MSTTLQFVLPATVAVAQLYIHYVEYSAMCNCASREVQTGMNCKSLVHLTLHDLVVISVKDHEGVGLTVSYEISS